MTDRRVTSDINTGLIKEGYIMGWLYSWELTSRKMLVDRLVSQEKDRGTYVDHSATGNELYMAVKTSSGDTIIICCKLQGAKENGWGYKDMDESMHPYMYNCPERILKLSTCMDESAVEWREACREARSKKNETSRLVSSLQTYSKIKTKSFGVLTFLYKGGRGFICRNEKGQIFRYAKKYFEGAELVEDIG